MLNYALSNISVITVKKNLMIDLDYGDIKKSALKIHNILMGLTLKTKML